MKLKWFKVGESIPDGSKYMSEKKEVVTEWDDSHPQLSPVANKWHYEYLYEVIEDPKETEK